MSYAIKPPLVKFEVGDRVRRRTGGPILTVVRIYPCADPYPVVQTLGCQEEGANPPAPVVALSSQQVERVED